MNKDKIKVIIAITGFFMLMVTAASVSADGDDEPGIIDREVIGINDGDDSGYDITASGDESNLISPNSEGDGDFENLILAPEDDFENEEDSSGIFTSNLLIVVGLSGFAGLALGLIIFGRNK